MKHILNRLVSLTLVLVMLLSLIPAGVMTASAEDSTKYGKATASVKVRKTASTSAQYWFSIPVDFVVLLKGEKEAGGIHWYKVEARKPDSPNPNTYIGYVHGNYFRPLTKAEETAYEASGSQYSASETTPAGETTPAAETTTPPPSVTTPASGDNYAAGTGATGAITSGGTNFREGPGKKYPKIVALERNTVVELVTIPTAIDENHWYKCIYDGKVGYIQSPYIRVISYGSSVTTKPVTTKPADVTTPPPTETISGEYGYVRLLLSSCHLRIAPEGAYNRANDWEDQYGTLPVCGKAVKKGKYTWYPVMKDGKKYYVRGDCVQYVGEDPAPTGSPTDPPTSAPTSTTTSETTPPVITTTPPPADPEGYVKTIKTGCNLRTAPKTDAARLLQIPINVKLPFYKQPTKDPNYSKNHYLWYPVEYNGKKGYLRSDVVEVTGADPTPTTTTTSETTPPAETTTPPPTDAPAESSYVKTVVGGVNLRVGASYAADPRFTGVAKNVVMKYGIARKVGDHTWYNVNYKNTSVWVVDTCVRVLTAEEAKEYEKKDDPTSAPTVTTTAQTIKGYVKTNTSEVNLRKDPAGAIIGRIKNKGTIMPYLKDPVKKNGVMWFYVKDAALGTGWVHGSYVTLCSESGEPTAVPTTTGSGESKQEAVYTTLKLGTTGDAVRNLVTELKNQGYFAGEITSIYNTAVEDAVTKFQTDKGLTVDGIAGAATQHKLFGTVPVGEGDINNLTMTLYAAEKIDWFTGGINALWSKGSNYKVYDVYTGIVWWAHRWSGFYHVDAEPLTAADTARLCKIYGVKNAKEIADKDLYQRRPSLVTIGSRTFACSLYGEPHNPEGNTITTNNFPGQLCIHFTNSKTSGTKIVDSGHQAAIQYAWEHAPNGHK